MFRTTKSFNCHRSQISHPPLQVDWFCCHWHHGLTSPCVISLYLLFSITRNTVIFPRDQSISCIIRTDDSSTSLWRGFGHQRLLWLCCRSRQQLLMFAWSIHHSVVQLCQTSLVQESTYAIAARITVEEPHQVNCVFVLIIFVVDCRIVWCRCCVLLCFVDVYCCVLCEEMLVVALA